MSSAEGKGKVVWTGQCSATALSQREGSLSTATSHSIDLRDDPTSTCSEMSWPLRQTGTL